MAISITDLQSTLAARLRALKPNVTARLDDDAIAMRSLFMLDVVGLATVADVAQDLQVVGTVAAALRSGEDHETLGGASTCHSRSDR